MQRLLIVPIIGSPVMKHMLTLSKLATSVPAQRQMYDHVSLESVERRISMSS